MRHATRRRRLRMKHIKPVTQRPQAAQTLLTSKIQFLSTAVPAGIQLYFDHFKHGAYPLSD